MNPFSKRKVLFVTHSDKKGGAEQSLIHLMNYIDTQKYKIYLLCPKQTSYLEEIKVPFEHVQIELKSLKEKLGLYYLRDTLRIISFVKTNKINIVHANGWRAPWYTGPLKYFTSTVSIWHHRDHMNSKLYNNILPCFFHRVICISNFVRDSLKCGQRTVVYNGVDLKMSVQKKRSFMEDDVFVVGMFGRIVDWKRYEYVIEAIKLLSDKNVRNCKLLIVGDTAVDGSDHYYEDLKRKVKVYDIEEQVAFYGYSHVPLEVMSQCDVTVNFSVNEPFGRVIIESMLVQTPVIVANSGGAPEIINLTGGGIIVEDGNFIQLATELRRLMNNHEEHQLLLKQGYRNVLEHFNMDMVVTKVSEVYENLLLKKKIK